MGAPSGLVSVAVAGVVMLVLAGCGAAREEGGRVSGLEVENAPGSRITQVGITLAEARAFGEFPLFFAGERVLGHPLVAILRRGDTARYVSFVYGDCAPAGLEGGCAPPIEIQVWPSGNRSLGLYDVLARASLRVEPTTVRGLPAAHVGESQLELYAGGSTVVVFGASREAALSVAARLRCLREGAPTTPAGTLAC